MAKPTPLKTATKSIINAQGCIEKILVGSNATGKYAKIGSDTRNDLDAVIAELEEIKEATTYLTESIANLLECMSPNPTDTLKSRIANLHVKNTAPSVDSFTDLPPVMTENNVGACTL